MNLRIKLEAVAPPRTIECIVAGVPTSDGAGGKLARVLTQNLQRRPWAFLTNSREENFQAIRDFH